VEVCGPDLRRARRIQLRDKEILASWSKRGLIGTCGSVHRKVGRCGYPGNVGESVVVNHNTRVFITALMTIITDRSAKIRGVEQVRTGLIQLRNKDSRFRPVSE